MLWRDGCGILRGRKVRLVEFCDLYLLYHHHVYPCPQVPHTAVCARAAHATLHQNTLKAREQHDAFKSALLTLTLNPGMGVLVQARGLGHLHEVLSAHHVVEQPQRDDAYECHPRLLVH